MPRESSPATLVCRKCLVEKPFAAFGRRANSRYGCYRQCRICRRASIKLSRDRDPDRAQKNRERARLWRAKNGDAYRNYQKGYHRVWYAAHHPRATD